MATIEVISENDVTMFTCNGAITVDELLSTISLEYNKRNIKNVIWDFTASSLESISTDKITHIASTIGKARELNGSGNTAFVCGNDIDFGKCRMYSSMSEFHNVDAKYMVFKDLEEAHEWIRNCAASEA